jgi:hypothetical protein
MPVSKNHAEQIVAEDLKRKYPNVEGIEFTAFQSHVDFVFHAESGAPKTEWRNYLWLSGMFKVKNSYGSFTYIIDAETGEIREYRIIPPMP